MIMHYFMSASCLFYYMMPYSRLLKVIQQPLNEGDTPLLVRSIQGGFRRYAVRKGSVRSTQKFCYIVRRQSFTLKRSNFHQKTQHT